MSFFKRIKNLADSKGRPASDADAVFSLSSAHITMETKLGLAFSGKAAICLKGVSGMQFEDMKNELARFFDISRADSGLRYRIATDQYGYLWVVLEDDEIEDMLAAVMAAGDTIKERGFSAQLLACVFEFTNTSDSALGDKKNPKYLIYNYKRNNFYPFVPLAGKKIRYVEDEMKIMSVLANEVPFERDMPLWYPLWDLPV